MLKRAETMKTKSFRYNIDLIMIAELVLTKNILAYLYTQDLNKID